MNLSQKQKAIIIGTLLGDGCLEKNGHNSRLRLEHTDKQRTYLEWKIQKLKKLITPASPMRVYAYHKENKRKYLSWRAYTLSTPVLDKLRTVFYSENRKVIPSNIAQILTNSLSLAVWYMDDGYKRNDCNAFRLSTDGFKKDEVYILSRVLLKNFRIKNLVHKKGKFWNIYIPRRSVHDFVKVIKPYVIPSMRYKIALAP